MPGALTHQRTPEEDELDRKRVELAGIRASLAERELELADLRSQLAAFEGRYLREVGVLYAELDSWDARVAELAASLERTASARERAERAKQKAAETHEATHGEASKAGDFKPSADLKNLFREAAKRIHPDFAKDAADQERRNRFMAEANAAYAKGDAETLQRILNEYREGTEEVGGEGIGAELVRIIRQIAQARRHIVAIEDQLATLRASEIAQLKQDVERAEQQGRDLLAELAATVGGQIARAEKEYDALWKEVAARGR